MPLRTKAPFVIALLIFLSTLSGCAKQQIASNEAIQKAAALQAEETTNTVEQVIDEAENTLQKAREDGLDFYSPLHLSNAQDSIEQAKDYLSNPPKEIKNAALMSAIAAKKMIEKAYDNKKLVKSNLKRTFANKAILDDLDAATKDEGRYEDIVDDIGSLIRKIEAGELDSALSGQDKVIQSMVAMEVDILLDTHLRPAELFLEKAESVDAEDFAPSTYLGAITQINLAKEFIQTNNRNRIGVEKAGKDALKAVQQAYFVAQDAKKLVNMVPEESEKHVLSLLEHLNELNSKASNEKLQPQSYENAASKTIELIALLKNQNNQLNQALATVNSELEGIKEKQANEQAEYEAEFEQDWPEGTGYSDEPVEVYEMEEAVEMSDETLE